MSLLLKKMSNLVAAGRTVNLSEIMVTYASSLICRIAFGKKYEEDGVEKSKFQSLATNTQTVFMKIAVSKFSSLWITSKQCSW